MCIKYGLEIRAFAWTLQHYSGKAYSFVRKTFSLALPHPAQIRKWYSKVQASFLALRAAVLSAKKQNRQVIAAAMIDEISIRKHTQWDGKKFKGLVDLGCGTTNQSDAVPLGK